jgi:hypothetical protein
MSLAHFPYRDKKENFSCKLQKTQTTRETLYGLFYLTAAIDEAPEAAARARGTLDFWQEIGYT